MIDESVPNRPLSAAALACVAGAGSLAKYASPWPTPCYLAELIPFPCPRTRFKPFQAIFPHIDRALTRFTLDGWRLTTAQSLTELTHRHASKRFLSDYTIGPNALPGVPRPTLDKTKDCLVPPVWGEQRASRLGPCGYRSYGIRRGTTFERGHRVRGTQRSK
jgi:hypothetical protein